MTEDLYLAEKIQTEKTAAKKDGLSGHRLQDDSCIAIALSHDGTGDHQDFAAEQDQNQDYTPDNNTGNRGDNGTSHETVTDSQGGNTVGGTPPDTSQADSAEDATPVTGTESTTVDNGDGTTTTTTSEADASQEVADGVLTMPD